MLTPLLTSEGNPFLLLTPTDCSKASSIFQLGVLFGNLLIGPITDTKGRKIPFFVCSFLIILVQGTFHNLFKPFSQVCPLTDQGHPDGALFVKCLQVLGCIFVTSVELFFAYRFISGLLTGTLTVLGFVYGNELLPKSVWSFTGNVIPCVFALGIAGLGTGFES